MLLAYICTTFASVVPDQSTSNCLALRKWHTSSVVYNADCLSYHLFHAACETYELHIFFQTFMFSNSSPISAFDLLLNLNQVLQASKKKSERKGPRSSPLMQNMKMLPVKGWSFPFV